MHKPQCSSCGNIKNRDGQRYCAECHSSYMKKWRKLHPPTKEQRFKSNARSYANSYQKRGLLKKMPCVVCGNQKAEKHHEDYRFPLKVVFLCREHHLDHHHKKILRMAA